MDSSLMYGKRWRFPARTAPGSLSALADVAFTES